MGLCHSRRREDDDRFMPVLRENTDNLQTNKLIQTFNLELPEALRQSQKFPLQRDEELQKMGLTLNLD